MSSYQHNDKKSGDGLAITDWNNLSSAVAGSAGLTLALPSAHLVGIGTNDPKSKLHVTGKVDVHQADGGGGQNRFVGLEAPSSASGRAQLVLSSCYSDLVIASSQTNHNHGSTLTFATYDPDNVGNYRKWVINQGNWGSRKQFLDFGYKDANGSANPHANINGTDTVLTLDGVNKRVGIGTMAPQGRLSIAGDGKESAPDGAMHITSDCILFGGKNSGKYADSAQISAGKHANNSLNIVGMSSGTSDADRKVDVWAEGGFTVRGEVTANKFIGDGSGLTNLGSGALGGTVNVHQLGAGGGQNRFVGLTGPTTDNGRAQLILSSSYSDLVIASSQANHNHGSTLTFATYDPDNVGDYRKWVINQGNWGSRKQFLDFGYKDANGSANPHANINGTDTVLTLDGVNKRVGIGTMAPQGRLSIAGDGKESGPDGAMHITDDCILFGGKNSGKQADSAQISAGKHQADSLCIVGMSTGTNGATRKVTVWAEGGLTVHGPITASKFTGLSLALGAVQTSDWINNWDGVMDWFCPPGHVMVGLYSEHDNNKEDRRFKVKYAQLVLHGA